MTKHRLFLLAIYVGLILYDGCGPERQYQVDQQICATNVDKSQAMQIAEDVLTGMHFVIEKADLESGLIRTRPLPAAQFFEFWRSDNVGSFNTALANLHSIQRTTQIHIQRQGDRLYICCDVQIQKLSLPEHEAAGRAGAPLKRLSFGAEQQIGMTWIDLGKDNKLAAEILKRVDQQTRNPKPEVPLLSQG